MKQTPSSQYNELREAAQALVDALPKCVKCGKPAMRSYGGTWHYCDGCGGHVEYPHAEPLRALIALLGVAP